VNRSIAGWIAHRWAKWVVLALSLIFVVGVGMMLGSKLTSVQDNDVASWLPGDAESTKVIQQSKAFANPDDIPAVVLYERGGGTTPADLAKATADVADLKGVKDVSNVLGPFPSEDGEALQVIATITMASDGWEALPDRVDDIRSITDKGDDGLDVSLAGPAALGADQSEAFAGIDGILLFSAVGIVFIILLVTYRSLQLIPVILVVVLLILGLLLRSIAAPLILLVTVVVSFAAAVGISALVFRHVFGFEGADSSFPLFAFVFLVALGIDYNIFLMTRVREESLKHGTRKGALIGLAATGGVITSAGFVLAGTFTALATLPIVFLAELGFVVAVGVLLDTIIVRSVLVTALNLDIGRHIWWPSALWRTDGPGHLADDAHPAEPVDASGQPAHKA
jgi:uncharacterized membrane protein YdfJ with MMPL/SSD domain